MAALTGAALAGCVVRERTTVYENPSLAQPGQTVVVADPVIVEYAAVPPPPVITEYVFINGGYYYYHPQRRVYVRLAGPPPQGVAVRRITRWSEDPMYAQVQHVAPPPVAVVSPPPHRGTAVVVVAPPVIVEASAVAAPRSITEYVLLNGSYYYYHPDRHVFVHITGRPPRGVAVREIHAWNEHPMYEKVEHVTVTERH